MSTKSVNRLAQEKSPYLLQHSTNPVLWYPWGEAAFAAARLAQKPIFLSIGYSTCYWCHVMERDSFERDDVAAVLNRDFISVKVDREERPDLDQIYMDVVVGLTGHGGWPMSVFLTEEGKPFWGGTFFWRAQFLQILEGLAKAWREQREKVVDSAEQILAAVSQERSGASELAVTSAVIERACEKLRSSYDESYGGFGAAPKFPPSQPLRLLLRSAVRASSQEDLAMVTFTLDRMSRGGIYDQLGGGFARYATDHEWKVPHFEKMLYDNALLANVYLECFQATQNLWFKSIASETLNFVLREMTSEDGSFFSAIDAGEVDREGEYYVWSYDEISSVLTPDELKLAVTIFEVSEGGNFEGANNVLVLRPEVSLEVRESHPVRYLKAKLLKIRDARIRPHTDDKILSSWNGMMISALAQGAKVLGDTAYLSGAIRAAEFLRDNLVVHGQLGRRYRGEDRMSLGFLEDYAFVIEGLISLYEAGFDEQWLKFARELQTSQDHLFLDAKNGGYFVSAANDIVTRKKEYFDGAIPAAVSITYQNLLRFQQFFPEDGYGEAAELLRRSFWGLIEEHPGAFSSFLLGVDFALGTPRQIGIILKPGELPSQSELVKVAQQCLLPSKVLGVVPHGERTMISFLKGKGLVEGGSAAYVCRDQRCDLPVVAVKDFKLKLGLSNEEHKDR